MVGAIIILVLVVVLGVVVYWLSTPPRQAKSTPTVSATHRSKATRVVATPTPQPTPTLVIQAIGKAVVVDSTWTVTVNSAKTSQGDAFSTPGAGNVYLVVDVTVKNTSTHYQYLLSGNQCVLKDSTGQSYREAITDFATPPDGYLKFGDVVPGQLAYEVPATLHTFYFFFQADTNGTDLTEWVLHV